MNKTLPHKKGVFALLLALFLGMGTAYASDFSEVYSGNTFYFNITDATHHYVEITFPGPSIIHPWEGYTKPTGSLTLPSTISHDGTNYTVKAIGEYAFYECDGLTGSLTIPNSVTSIGQFAFQICSGLTGSLNLGNSVTEIGPYAFMQCGFTGSLTLPNTLTSIAEIAFGYCDGFTGSLNIPNSVTSIGEAAFAGCTGLTGTLTIGTSVASIGQSAFKNCNGFSQVNYNAINCADVSETDNPFEGITATTLTIGNQVQRIPYYMFYDCSSFTGSLTIPNSVTSIGNCAFDHCTGFTGTLTLGSSVTSIGWSAFYYCSGFTGSLVIPNSVTTIDDYAFTHCDGLTGGLTLGSSLNYIGDMVFAYCPFTGTLTIPNSVTVIDQAAFYECTGLTGQLIIPGSVIQINNSAFYNCSGFTGPLTIPNSVTLIGNSVFADCTGFTGKLTIGASVSSIGNYAFSGCSNLSSMIVYPETPPTLGSNAFLYVPKTIPVKVPCGKVSTYQNASGWNAFTNIQEYCDPLTYSINPDGVSVTVTGHVDGTNATGELIIPEAKVIDGVAYTVTAIGNYAFSHCSGLTGSLIIPNTVTAIGNFAFSECSGLTGNLTIPNTVTSIGRYAFQVCTGFTGTLTLPSSLTTMEAGAFYLCSGFTGNLTLPNSLTVINKDVFTSCSGFTGSLIIPESVTSIGENAFYSCRGFTGSLTIPNSVTTIGNCAFYNCTGFTGNLTIPRGTIGNNAFVGCNSFAGTLSISTGVTSIGTSAFNNCSNFSQVNFNAVNCADVTASDMPFEGCGGVLTIQNNVHSIPAYMFNGGGFTGTLTIGTGVTSIGTNAFKDCSGFTQVNYNAINCANISTSTKPFENCTATTLTIGNSVQRIPNYLFFGCSNFTGSLTIPDSVTEIGIGAFRNCTGFTGSLTLGNSLVSLGIDAFTNCKFTGSLTIPNSVTTIDMCAFWYCTGFNGALIIGTGVTSIGKNAFGYCSGFTQVNYNAVNCADVAEDTKPFEGCTAATSLYIGSSVTRIPAYMFYECNKFTGSLNIPNSVTSIGDFAFENCTGFNGSLSLGNSLTEIGQSAFYFCVNFTGSLSLPNSLTTIGTYAFYQCQNLSGTLTIPNSVTTLGIYAFALCIDFTGLTIGSSVSTINYGAFYSCSGLTSMTVLPNTPPTLGTSGYGTTVFQNVPTDIPVYVPCESLSAYQTYNNGEHWGGFTNMQCQSMVTITVVPTEGGTVTGGGTYSSGQQCTVTATPNSNYLFLHWRKDGEMVSTGASYSFNVTQDVNLEAVFMAQANAGDIIGSGEDNNAYLPSYSTYNYTLSQQIYTADELGGSRTITSISFFNAGYEKTRSYDIYLKHTSKTTFGSDTDWISVTSSDKVYSGTVTMREGLWTTIVLDTPFDYNGTSNLVLVVDDNTGSWSSGMRCRVYNAVGNQALRIYSDNTNYNPLSPSSYTGTLMSVKNQIMFNRQAYNIVATSANTDTGTVSGDGTYGIGDLCRLKATAQSGYTFLDWTDDESGFVVSTEANYTFPVTENRSLTAHFMPGSNNACSLTFDLFDSYGDGWNGNYLVVTYGNGTSVQLTIPDGDGAFYASFTLPVEYFDMVDLSWIQGNWPQECSFTVSDPVGLKYMGTNMNENYEHSITADCGGDSELTYLGNHSTANNQYLPSYSFYNYSLSEQIYTAEEIGTSGLISCIAFYNQGAETKSRSYDIYMTATDKTAFTSQTDWISASDAVKVYSGEDSNGDPRYVTMQSGRWTPIVFDTPFDYDGSSNLVLIVDDNTGSYTSAPHMSCLVYTTDEIQALRIYSDGTDYNPTAPSYSGILANVKNQVFLNIVPCEEPTDLMASNITTTSADISWNSSNYNFELQYREASPNNDFENGLGSWTTIDADGDGKGWMLGSEFFSSSLGHNGSADFMTSQSWYGSPLTPDNYLVSPQIILGGSITFWACAQDPDWAAEHFGVAVSTTGNTNPADFTTIQEWTMTAKGTGAMVNPETTRSGSRSQGTWYEYTVNLNDYSGTGYVAIRHFDCTDQFHLNVDDITITQPGVYWRPAYNVANPYTITGLTPETSYDVRVRSKCAQGFYSDWVYTTFTTLPESVTQTVALAAGTNWFSSNVEITLADLQNALLAALNNARGIKITSQTNGTSMWTGSAWRGTIDPFDVSQHFVILVPSDCEIELEGLPINPDSHTLSIVPGNNWIGFPLGQSMSVTDAFAGFPVRNDRISSQTSGFTTFNGSTWRGNLNTLQPGQGYIYNSASSETRTLVFPSSK